MGVAQGNSKHYRVQRRAPRLAAEHDARMLSTHHTDTAWCKQNHSVVDFRNKQSQHGEYWRTSNNLEY